MARAVMRSRRGVVDGATDDDRGAFLGTGLVGEGERNQDYVAEAIAGRRRHRRSCFERGLGGPGGGLGELLCVAPFSLSSPDFSVKRT